MWQNLQKLMIQFCFFHNNPLDTLPAALCWATRFSGLGLDTVFSENLAVTSRWVRKKSHGFQSTQLITTLHTMSMNTYQQRCLQTCKSDRNCLQPLPTSQSPAHTDKCGICSFPPQACLPAAYAFLPPNQLRFLREIIPDLHSNPNQVISPHDGLLLHHVLLFIII